MGYFIFYYLFLLSIFIKKHSMKNLFFVLFVLFFGTKSVFSNTSEIKSITTDTIFANITPSQANDTIIAHVNDPWFVILDVRTPSEYSVKHLAEGVDIDFYAAAFAATLATLNRSKTYVLHCASGGRSGQVYIMMQNLHFSKVYNMTGGITAWSNAGLPVTTSEAPATGILCDTIASFNNIPLGQTDSIQLTITNAANSTLSFTNISGISGTDFSTNFNTGISFLGARDYSFNIYYNPSDLFSDSTVFSIESNCGIMNFYLYGTADAPTGINKSTLNAFAIYNDNGSHTFSFQLNNINEPTVISICDMNGKIVYEKPQTNQTISVDYSTWKNSIYLLHIKNINESKTYKLPLIH